MSHHSVESMRDRAFRKGRNAFKNDAEYRAALAGELDDPGTAADGIDAARDMLDGCLLTASDIDNIHYWLEEVMASKYRGDLPPNFEQEDVNGDVICFETLGSADRVCLRDPDGRYCEIAATDLEVLIDDLEPCDDDEDEETGEEDDEEPFLP